MQIIFNVLKKIRYFVIDTDGLLDCFGSMEQLLTSLLIEWLSSHRFLLVLVD